MRYIKITYPDINNGLGCRCTLWVSGCTHHCKDCHNKFSWDFNIGKIFTNEDKDELIDILKKDYIKGLTLSGGDPMDSYNDALNLLKFVKTTLPQKDVWLYTGYTIDEIARHNQTDILKYIDYLVDGAFDINKRNVSLKFRGSENQIIWEKDEKGEWVKSELNN